MTQKECQDLGIPFEILPDNEYKAIAPEGED